MARLLIALTVATMFAACGAVAGTPPPRFEAIKGLMEPGGVSMEFIDPSRLGGLPISRDAAEAAARKQHAVRGPGEREPIVDHLETWAASVTVTARPGIPGGTHTAWLVALVEPGGIAAEMVIVVRRRVLSSRPTRAPWGRSSCLATGRRPNLERSGSMASTGQIVRPGSFTGF